MRELSPLILPQPHGSVTRTRDLRAAGNAHWRLYRRDTPRAVYGIVAAPGVDPLALDTRIAAARVLLQHGMFLSRRTAAYVLGLPVDNPGLTVEIGAVRPIKPPARAEFTTHQVRQASLLEVPSAPQWLPHPADVWALLGPVSSVTQLVVIGDCIVSGRNRHAPALATPDELTHAVSRNVGGRGVAQLRAALPHIRVGVESPAESRLRLLITQAGFPEPVIACPVVTALRRFHADLGYPHLKIAIEYEGEYHFTGGAEQARWDLRRYDAMHDAGWIVLRATALDLRDPRHFHGRLAAAMRQARGRTR